MTIICMIVDVKSVSLIELTKGVVDTMNRPKHYENDTFIDVIDFCNLYKLDFIECNIIKYIVRYKKKDGIKDLEKALVYLNRLIDIASIKIK